MNKTIDPAGPVASVNNKTADDATTPDDRAAKAATPDRSTRPPVPVVTESTNRITTASAATATDLPPFDQPTQDLPALELPALDLPSPVVGNVDPALTASQPVDSVERIETPAEFAPYQPPSPAVSVFQPVWTNFRSEVSASGFAAQLETSVTQPLEVIRVGPGQYQVGFRYAEEADRQRALDTVTAITGFTAFPEAAPGQSW